MQAGMNHSYSILVLLAPVLHFRGSLFKNWEFGSSISEVKLMCFGSSSSKKDSLHKIKRKTLVYLALFL